MARDDLARVARELRAALDRGDEWALALLLHHDVRLIVDADGADGREVHGRASVARALRALRTSHPDAAVSPAPVNAGAGLVLRRDGLAVAVIAMGTRVGGGASDHAISDLWVTTAPAKLVSWHLHGSSQT